MTSAIAERWKSLQDRERIFITVGAAALAAMGIYALLLDPLIQERSRLLVALPRLSEDAAKARLMAMEVKELRENLGAANTFTSDRDTLMAMETLAQTYQISFRIAQAPVQDNALYSTPGSGAGEEDLISITGNGPFTGLFGWLEELRRTEGIVVDRLKLETATKPGIVSFTATLVVRY